MDLGIKGRRAIVNGGSAGMGRSAVLALAREGVEVFVSARTEAGFAGQAGTRVARPMPHVLAGLRFATPG